VKTREGTRARVGDGQLVMRLRRWMMSLALAARVSIQTK
jgi:hypothetical protein